MIIDCKLIQKIKFSKLVRVDPLIRVFFVIEKSFQTYLNKYLKANFF